MITISLSVNGTQTFTSENVKLGTFSLNRYSSSAIAPEFGNVSAGELVFSIDTTTTSATLERGDIITGSWSENGTTTSIGEFVVTNLVKGYNELNVTCLDKMILLDGVADLTGITYPITAASFIDTIYRQGLGLTVTIDTNVYSSVSLNTPAFSDDFTYRQVLSKVCECMGANAWYKDGLKIGFYKTSNKSITDEDYMSEDTTDDGFTVEVNVTDDINAKAVEIVDNEITISIIANPFLSQYTETEKTALATAIKSNIGNVTWYGGNITMLPDPTVNIMDIVEVETMDGSTKAFPITSITYGINENTNIIAKIDSADNDYNYSLTREMGRVKDEIENLEIGGVNLLHDTNAPSLTKVYATNDRYWSNAAYTGAVGSFITISDPPTPTISNGVEITVTTTDTRDKSLTWYRSARVPLTEGDTYTLSCYARLTSGTKGTVALYYGAGTYDYWTQEITSTDWVRIKRTFTLDSQYMTTDGTRVYIGVQGDTAGTIQMCGFQLEEGTKMTAYNRSLDTDTQVERTSSYFWHDDEGAHVSDTPNALTGKNVLIDSDSVDIRNALNTLATFYAEDNWGYFSVFNATGDNAIFTAGGFRSQNESFSIISSDQEAVHTTYDTIHAAGVNQVTLKERIGMLTDDGENYYAADDASKVIALHTAAGGEKQFRFNSDGTITFHTNTKLNMGGTNPSTTQEVIFWGNSGNKIGIAVTNTVDNKQFGLQVRGGNIRLYNYTDAQTEYILYPILTKTVTGTTNTRGNLNLSLDGASYTVLSVIPASGKWAIPFIYTASGGALQCWAKILTDGASFSPVVSSSETVTVYYQQK